MLLTLGGCASSRSPVVVEHRLAPIPADVRTCFTSEYKLPPGEEYTKAQVLEVIGALVKQDKVKSACGQRLIAWYEKQK